MEETGKAIAAIIVSYIFGSIPFGVLISKYKGVDLRSRGSGNIGATNVLRTSGKGPAAMTLLGDLLKGALVIFLARKIYSDPWIALCGVAVILGHIFPLFLKFKGGKGVATAFGVILVYSPVVAFSAILIWIITVYSFRYSSLGAVISFLLLPGIMAVLDRDKTKVLFAFAASIMVLLRHTGNIGRLLKGSEKKIGEKA